MSVYSAVKIADGFYAIEENMVRVFLFEGEDEALLIDAGFGTGDLKAFVATLTDKPVRRVLLTHADIDHTGSCHQFEEVWMHPSEYARFKVKDGEPAPIMHPLWEGDEIKIGAYTLRVLHIPGHTPGSVVYLDSAHRFLIGGDSVQTGSIFMFGEGRDMRAFVCSMEKLQRYADAFDTVYASHSELRVTENLLPHLRQGALDVIAGKIPDQPPGRELPCRLFDCGKVRFFYKP